MKAIQRYFSSFPKSTDLYSRQYFRQLEKNKIRWVQRSDAKQRKAFIQEKVFNLVGNQANPQNRVVCKMNSQILKLRQQNTTNPSINPSHNTQYIKKDQLQKQQKRLISAIHTNIVYSLKKYIQVIRMYLINRQLRKKHVLNAIGILQGMHTKGAKIIVKTFYNLLDHAKNRNFDIKRLFVHVVCYNKGVVLMKQYKRKKIRYHAKFRRGKMQTNVIKVRVILQQKDQKQFYKQVFNGKTPTALAAHMRSSLKEERMNYEYIRKYQHILTAKGRQQARQMVKRKADLMLKNGQVDSDTPRKLVIQQILQQMAQKHMQEMQKTKLAIQQSWLKQRQQIFRQNLKKN